MPAEAPSLPHRARGRVGGGVAVPRAEGLSGALVQGVGGLGGVRALLCGMAIAMTQGREGRGTYHDWARCAAVDTIATREQSRDSYPVWCGRR